MATVIELYCPVCGKFSVTLTLQEAGKIGVKMQKGKKFLTACKECGHNTPLSTWTLKVINSLAWSVS